MVARQMPGLPYYADGIFHPSSKYSRSGLKFSSSLPKTAFGFKKSEDKITTGFTLSSRTSMEASTSSAYLSSMHTRRMSWSARRSTVDGRGSDPPGGTTNGRTRLVRVIQSFRIKLTARIIDLKKGLPVKVLFFLLGFYCATAFATVIGQTGDWDILSAGLAVVVVEGIGALMYRGSLRLLDRVKSLVTLFNYWKAGLSLGLFLDAFKYEIDMFLGSFGPFDIEIDVFPIFW